MRVKEWICSSLLVVASVAPVLAGTKDTTDSKAPAETAAAAAAAARPNGAPTAGTANVTALLGVLVMKGVLAPSEANAIRNAAPDVEFQMLLELLARKGVLSPSDLSAAAPAATPVPAVAAQPTQA